MTQAAQTVLYAEHNHVLCRLVQWDEVFGAGGGASQFSSDVTLHAPDASIGNKDRVVILQVVCCGPGNVSRGKLNPCPLEEGDLVIANLFHRTDEVCLMGETFSLFNWEHIMAKLTVDDVARAIKLDPLQAFVVCKPNPEAAQRLMMGKSRILLPGVDSQHAGPPELDVRGRPIMPKKVVIEECVLVGPGAVVDGMWQEPPPDLVGAMVMYDTGVSPTRFVACGEAFTLVHWRHVQLSFRKEPANASEEIPEGTPEGAPEEQARGHLN